jgi:hypothetical protein
MMSSSGLIERNQPEPHSLSLALILMRIAFNHSPEHNSAAFAGAATHQQFPD